MYRRDAALLWCLWIYGRPKGRGMIDEYKKFIGVLILVIAAAVSVFVMKTYYPEFYDQTIQLTLAGDIDGLGD